jgi:large subunit ribosomal protein L12
MEYIYSAMLLHKAGQKVDEANIKKVLEAAGIKVDEARVKALVAALEGVNIDEAIEKAAMPVGAVPATAAVEEKAEEKKEEKKKRRRREKKRGGGSCRIRSIVWVSTWLMSNTFSFLLVTFH